MKIIRQNGILGTCVVFALFIGVYSLQTGAARGDSDVSKRQDFATDDTTFGTNEDIYIRVDLNQLPKLKPGNARLKVLVKQKGKKRLKESVQLVVTSPKTEVSYRDDIQPLFTQDRAWFDKPDEHASEACGFCHFSTEGGVGSFHRMDLTTHAGMLNGAEGGEKPILGESSVGATDYNWDERSVLNRRFRDNRMPPGFPFNFPGAGNNRNGPDIDTVNDGDDLALTGSDWFVKRDVSGNFQYAGDSGFSTNAVGLIGAWVDGTSAGINDGNGTPYGGDTDVTWSDVAPFLTGRDTWFNGSLACSFCHLSNEEPPSFHAMDLTSAAGLRGGADDGEEPILGESFVGATDFNWDASELRRRLRNNRMPPNAPFVLDGSNRNGPTLIHPVTGAEVSAVNLIGEWVGNGVPNN